VPELRRQLRAVGPAFVVGAAVIVAIYLVAFVVIRAADRDFNVATEDPAVSLGGPIYTGVFSYLGVLGWWTAAVVAGVTGALLLQAGLRAAAMPFLALTFISTLFAFDDMLLVHEVALDKHLGIPQYVSFGVYALVFGLLMWHYRAFVRDSDWALLAAFVAFFGVAGVIDQVGDISGDHHNVPEEALELLGIMSWALYGVRCSLRELMVRAGSAPTRGATPRA
jgi:hypothetical protein